MKMRNQLSSRNLFSTEYEDEIGLFVLSFLFSNEALAFLFLQIGQ